MTRSAATTSGSDTSVAAYEQLRSGVLAHSGSGGHRGLAHSSSGGHRGLALLLREGIAAWLSRGSAGSVAAAPAAEPGPRAHAATAIVSDAIGAHVVGVLASMALGGLGKEIRT